MTGFLIFLGVIVLLAVALEVTHRRRPSSWRPGLDTRRDRDAARLHDDLRAAEQRDPFTFLRPDLKQLTPGREVADAWRYSNRAA